METQKTETLIAKKISQLISMISLGTANRYLGNTKSLAGSARALRKVNSKPAFQALINEIEALQWQLECQQVEQFFKQRGQ